MKEKRIPSFDEEHIEAVLQDISDISSQTPRSLGETAFDALLNDYVEKGLIREL